MTDILYFGDAKVERGFDYVYELSKRLTDVKFKIVMRYKFADCDRYLNEMKYMKNVRLILFACPKRLKEEIMDAKIILLPYKWMAMRPPLTLVEAMSLGKFVITSGLGGDEELIIDGFNGRMMDFSNLEPIISNIRYFLGNDEFREYTGQMAKETIEKLYTEKEFEKIEYVWEQQRGY